MSFSPKGTSGTQVSNPPASTDSEPMETGSQGSQGGGPFRGSTPSGDVEEYHGKNKLRKEITFIQNHHNRTARFRRRAAVIMQTARELVIQTAAKITIRMEYVGIRGTKIYNFPGEEEIDSELDESQRPGRAGMGSMKDVVKEGVKEAMSEMNMNANVPSSTLNLDFATADEGEESDASQGSQESSSSAFELQSGRDASACFVCTGTTYVVRERFSDIESEFVKCAVPTCVGRAHYDCLGVPQLGPEDQLDGKWYCHLHIGVGRSMVTGRDIVAAAVQQRQAAAAAFFSQPGQSAPAKKRGRPPGQGSSRSAGTGRAAGAGRASGSGRSTRGSAAGAGRAAGPSRGPKYGR